MKTCSTCGAMNDDNSMNCTNCGSQFVVAQPQMGYEQIQGGYAQPQMGYEQMQGGYAQPQMSYGQQPPAKKSKTKLIVILVIVAILVLAGVGVLIWYLVSSAADKKKPVEMVEKVVEAYADCDATYLASVTPDFLDTDVSDYDTAFAFLAEFDPEYELVSMDEPKFMDKDDIKDLEEEIEEYYDDEVEIQKACTIKAEMSITLNYWGETSTEESDTTFTCIKLDGEWYVYEGL